MRIIIKSVFLARDLINEPANKSKSQTFISIITKFIKDNKIPVQLEIKDKKELQKLGMGLILGVGQASNPANEPKLLILKYITKECKGKQGKSKQGKKIRTIKR